VAKLDWEKAKRPSGVPPAEKEGTHRQGSAKRQAALAAFVEKHGLRCFKCDSDKA
jgi:hypothetical protein